MNNTLYWFYECDNPSCGLRFPGYEGAPRWNRCPVCRSNTHKVARVTAALQASDRISSEKTWQIEALLDNIRSAWNVGSIFRTADGIGVRKIHLCGITPTPENPKMGKTALGAESSVPWEHSNNGVNTACTLISRGYKLWVLEDLTGAIPLFTINDLLPDAPLVLVAGNEVCGVDPGIIELSDRVISIPMLGKKQSHNVAIAFGIAASFLVYQLSSGARGSPMDHARYFQGPD